MVTSVKDLDIISKSYDDVLLYLEITPDEYIRMIESEGKSILGRF